MISTADPAANTRSKTKERAQEHCEQLLQKELSPIICKDSKERLPFQALKEFVSAVIDKETGKKLEYRDLLRHPKLK